MFKIIIKGSFNNSLKKKKLINNNPRSILFFTQILRVLNPSVKINFFLSKKKDFNFFFVKSTLRYKISKHILQRNNNKFCLIITDNCLNKNLACMSSSYLNLNTIRFFITTKKHYFFSNI